ncbi:hypothetical protein M9Y10_015791 [Tritrichomonas musculus]|uniref:Uncharacterized protein n=1 Tax=Tritrichomonas musculus TaxID=1915356 RepID=A0ABR2I5B0_9EUKA
MNILPDFTFSRIGTEPLEHKFGYSRIKSRDISTLTKFIRVIALTQGIDNIMAVQKMNCFNDEVEKIHGKPNITDIKAEPRDENDELYSIGAPEDDDLLFAPQKIVLAMLSFAGFELNNIYCEKSDLIIQWLILFFEQLSEDEPVKRKIKKALSLSHANMGTNQSSQNLTRMSGQEIIKSNRQQNKKELIMTFHMLESNDFISNILFNQLLESASKKTQ